MLARLRIYLTGMSEFSINFASLFHGAMMEIISPKTADYLHSTNINPYSQSISFDQSKGHFIWEICTLTKEMRDAIIEPLSKIDELTLKHKNITLKVVDKELEEMSYRDLLEQNYFAQCSNIIKVRLLSPTSFRQKKTYNIFPDIRLIMQSLMMKYDEFSPENSIFSEELLADYIENMQIIGYNLKSVFYHTDGTKIPSFVGEITFKIYGPQLMVNLAHMLLHFGTYSGVGIKSSLGMGHLNIMRKERHYAGK